MKENWNEAKAAAVKGKEDEIQQILVEPKPSRVFAKPSRHTYKQT